MHFVLHEIHDLDCHYKQMNVNQMPFCAHVTTTLPQQSRIGNAIAFKVFQTVSEFVKGNMEPPQLKHHWIMLPLKF